MGASADIDRCNCNTIHTEVVNVIRRHMPGDDTLNKSGALQINKEQAHLLYKCACSHFLSLLFSLTDDCRGRWNPLIAKSNSLKIFRH